MKRKAKRKQFPSISRIINDKEVLLIILCSIFIFVAIVIVSSDALKNLEGSRNVLAQKTSLIEERDKWEKILIRYPDYRDGFLALSRIQYQLGDPNGALNSINTALKIDPNSTEAKKFKQFLESN